MECLFGLSPISAEALPSVLFIHGEHDEVFPVTQAQAVAACLETNGAQVKFKVLPGQSHDFGANRLIVFRVLAEQCLTQLKGPDALAKYRSVLSWREQTEPLWRFWTPAFVWVILWLWLCRGVALASRASMGTKAGWDQTRAAPWYWGILVRWAAAILAIAALAQTTLHLVPLHFGTTELTLRIARKHLVQSEELSDFDFLVANPVWRSKPLKTLLEHVELAHYNRKLIGWKLDQQVYHNFVLSPQIDPLADGKLNWRRLLWENFYPRIRKEQNAQAAAEVVGRFLRERVTIAREAGPPATVAEIWKRQITNERGFEAVYVAAMRSAGIPARLDKEGRAEFWTGAAWHPAPRPVVEEAQVELVDNGHALNPPPGTVPSQGRHLP
jgi:hypothetical protein